MRMNNYDYSRDNRYFITLNVSGGLCCFGEINGEMILSEYGKIAEEQWLWLEKQYPYVILHDYVVMPDHFHGIIEINRHAPGMTAISGTIKIKPVPELIGAFETTVSKKIHLCGFKDFSWQRSYYDSIIRDERRYHRIIDYIRRNPENWIKKRSGNPG